MQVGGLPPDNGPGGGAKFQDLRVEAAKEGGQSYAAVFKQKTTPYQRMDLTYIEPQLVDGKPLVHIPYSVTMAGEERWKHTLIGYVLGLNPSFTDMEGFVKARWAELGAMESKEVRQGALERGPWSFSRRPLILRLWSVRMALEKPDVDNLPAVGKGVVIERDIPSSSGTMQFGAIEVDPATLLPTPVGSVVKELRQDTPVSRGDTEVLAMQLSPIGEEDASGEDVEKESKSDLEANILQKVSSVIAQLAAESVEQQRGGTGNTRRSKKKGRVAAPPPKPV
ncbi:hypothetical protein LIER_41992 [Lithospermum erythrorhizon]|uniref:DUF4283 domain-containing protein n=1 Tax=Lithospermum erythrorhizon TaxID=34254 RepID=A0AAV3RJA8_LITER